ncbi:MAG: 50S ribosomal protein L15 [Candidatus Dadabacteria bacterium]|nr:MAG: 50S ribosomal protein L15 [Candidatus Dadabacteria bacterium]
METALYTLSPSRGSRHKRKRVGRGESSGLGKTSGRGTKGQGARSGASIPARFEGGQMPLYRRIPKFGFTSKRKIWKRKNLSVIRVEKLNIFNDGEEVTVEKLKEAGIIKKRASAVKVIKGGELLKKIKVRLQAVSSGAKAVIEEKGGEVVVLAKEQTADKGVE